MNTNKKVITFGGGTGLSSLLRGLKQFPVDITAIVTVSDDGRSTGRLREEFNVPAVGDIRQVIVSLSETEPLVQKLLNYRFKTNDDLNGHALGNLLLTGLIDVAGSFSTGIESLGKVLNLKGKVLPITEDNVTLVGEMEDGTIIEGEHHITESNSKIKRVFYKEQPKVLPEVIKEIKDADLVILSMGSLYTSIIPNLICDEVKQALDESKAEIMYVCNMMTQPGETDNFKVSDHVNTLNEYLGNKKVSLVIANNGEVSKEMKEKYSTLEQKDPVIIDEESLEQLNITTILDNLVNVDYGTLKHNNTKLGLQIFSYLMK